MTFRFLIDAQLPPDLTGWLKERGYKAQHVFGLGLARASDREIWDLAEKQGAVLVTKDEDFVGLAAARGRGPAVIWIRLGNTSTAVLLERLGSLFPRVEEALRTGDRLVEVGQSVGTAAPRLP